MTDDNYDNIENGALGEAMCSALLMERFWVLKRSVDKHGGDFFIQLRSASAKFTDVLPPRIGTVQSKFSQNKKTIHYLKKEYVVDEYDTPLPGFFLLIHMGKGKSMRRFLLSSTEIACNIPTVIKDKKYFYSIGAVAYSEQFEVNTNEDALDKIESILVERSEADRRKFLESVLIPDYSFNRSDVDPEWMLPIPNEHAYIPDEIYLVKSSLKVALYAYDEVQHLIGDILLAKSPDETVKLLKKLRQSHEVYEKDAKYFLQPYAQPLNLSIELDKAVKLHKSRYKLLQESGLLSAYLGVLKNVSNSCKKSYDKMEPTKKQIDKQSFTFEPIICSIGVSIEAVSKSFANIVIVEGNADSLTSSFDIVVEGKIFTSWFDYGKLGGWRDMHRLIERVMWEYFKLLFPTEHVKDPKQVRLLMV